MQRYRAWCFTLNNYTENEWTRICKTACTYIVVGKEVGEQGTPHLQGYIYMPNKTSLSAIKQLIGHRAHLEAAKGDAESNRVYCTKQNNFFEDGKKPATQSEKGQAEKDRWSTALEQARKTGQVEDPQIAFKHARTIDYLHQKDLRERKLEDTTVEMEWYHGPTGTGKSWKARRENPEAFLKMCNKWWCGYTEQDVVLIEDFDSKHHVLVHHLKIWADRYPFPAEVKGGTIVIRPKKIIVTSNYHPRDIWHDEGDLGPILRRFKVTEFT